MANGFYVGTNQIAQNCTKGYIGANEKAREITKIYIGANNIAHLAYQKVDTQSVFTSTWYTSSIYPGDMYDTTALTEASTTSTEYETSLMGMRTAVSISETFSNSQSYASRLYSTGYVVLTKVTSTQSGLWGGYTTYQFRQDQTNSATKYCTNVSDGVAIGNRTEYNTYTVYAAGVTGISDTAISKNTTYSCNRTGYGDEPQYAYVFNTRATVAIESDISTTGTIYHTAEFTTAYTGISSLTYTAEILTSTWYTSSVDPGDMYNTTALTAESTTREEYETGTVTTGTSYGTESMYYQMSFRNAGTTDQVQNVNYRTEFYVAPYVNVTTVRDTQVCKTFAYPAASTTLTFTFATISVLNNANSGSSSATYSAAAAASNSYTGTFNGTITVRLSNIDLTTNGQWNRTQLVNCYNNGYATSASWGFTNKVMASTTGTTYLTAESTTNTIYYTAETTTAYTGVSSSTYSSIPV